MMPVATEVAAAPPGAARALHGLGGRSPLAFANRVLEVGTELLAARIADARRPRGPALLRIEDGRAVPAAPRGLALYVHWSPDGAVSAMVLAQLAAYRAEGFALAFVSVADRVPEADWEAVRDAAALVAQRRNFGRDFGAWHDLAGEALRRWPGVEELLLVNDSVLGPLAPLGPVFAAARAAGPGLSGLTESLGGGAHLQSYFLLAEGRAAVAALAGFLASYRPTASKWLTVQRGEIALSRTLAAAGVKLRALYGHDRLVAAALGDPAERARLVAAAPHLAGLDDAAIRRSLRERPLNPTHHLWSALRRGLGFPFLKTELVRRNPLAIPDVADWSTMVGPEAPCGLPVLAAHLRALGP